MDDTKKIVIGVLGIAILIVGSLLVTATIVTRDVSVETAEVVTPTLTGEQVSTIVGSVVKGTIDEIELERENGRVLYSVEVSGASGEYDVSLDPYTGEVVKVEKETDVGRKEVELIESKITEARAKIIARGVVQGTVKDVEVEKVNGKYIYEVELDKDGSEFEVSIDLLTGQVLGVKEELQEELPDDDELARTGRVTRDEAIQIARDRLGSGWSLEETETGRYRGLEVWELEFEDGDEEAEVKIDIETGEILDIEYEDEDD